MKQIPENSAKKPKKSAEKQPSPFFLALVLTGMLALEMYPTLVETASANAVALKLSTLQTQFQDRVAEPKIPQAIRIPTENNSAFSRNPVFVNQPRSQIKQPATLLNNVSVLAHSAKGGPNRPTPLPTSVNLPQEVRKAVLQAATKQSGLATSALKIVEAKQQTWPDGCLGLADPEMVCSMALVPGWQVTAANGKRRWVYRTNESGSVVKWDKAASQ